jgi:MauM/NapG family ferredoxin protein
MTFQRTVQTLSLILFALFLWLAAFPLVSTLPVEAFLRLDPLVFLGVSLSGRTIESSLWISLALLAFSFVLGRFYCSTLCPMGITIDMVDRISKKTRDRTPVELSRRLRQFKHQVLLFILGAALFGVSLVYLASPLSWVTRLYGLILHPVLCFLGDSALGAVRPIARHWNMTSLAYAQVNAPHFDLQWPTVLFFVFICACTRYSPRFWCRYLCPSGAILALISSQPLIRRRVSDECIRCGLCIRKCPMGAISEDPRVTDHRKCIVCESCVRICPSNAVSFGLPSSGQRGSSTNLFCPDRRKVLAAGASGIGAALVTLTSLRHIEGNSGPVKSSHLELLRPPGAMPENNFLARCIGCGECMKACPTNSLQPAGLAAGLSGFFSPVVTPHQGACEPLCNVCGNVCPTGAIRPLPLEEKIWARVGTAHILRHKCLAWEHGKKCLVCAEFCPFEALEFRMTPEIPVAVPFVDETKCSGCGMCEHNCPVQARSAVVIEPMGAIRLASGSCRERGREMGLSLSIRRKEAGKHPLDHGDGNTEDLDHQALPPGFTD